MKFYVKWFKSYSLNRWTDTQMDIEMDRHDQKHYLPAFLGGNDSKIIFTFTKTLTYITAIFFKMPNELRSTRTYFLYIQLKTSDIPSKIFKTPNMS